jgi:hypothetical protein
MIKTVVRVAPARLARRPVVIEKNNVESNVCCFF